jgi:predicted Zn-dependent protease
MVLGAAKSWAIKTTANEAFYADVNALLYKNENAMRYLTAISTAHNDVSWTMVMRAAYLHKNGLPYETPVTADAVAAAQKTYLDIKAALAADEWAHEDFKAEFLLAAEGVCLLAELGAALSGIKTTRLVNTEDFLTRYRAKWVEKNKESELSRMEEIFRYCDTITAE